MYVKQHLRWQIHTYCMQKVHTTSYKNDYILKASAVNALKKLH